MSIKYNEDMIREAVDIAVGDDGFRSGEVLEILKYLAKQEPQAVDDYYMSLKDCWWINLKETKYYCAMRITPGFGEMLSVF